MVKITDTSFKSREAAVFVEIMDRIQTQNPDMGGIFLEATGMQGVAKTAVILTFAEDTIKNHPDQKLFWRNPYFAPFQFTKLNADLWEIFLEEGSKVTFHDRGNHLEEIGLNYRTFTTLNDLYKKAKPGVLTAVFFENEIRWYDFIHFLRGVGEWCHLFLDEYGELFPANPSGALYHRIINVSNDLKEVRKCFICVYATTQVTSDVDWRVRSKIMILAYLFGARPVSASRVTQMAIDALDRNIVKGNEVWLEEGFGRFGKGRFVKIYRPKSYMNWQANKPEDAIKITDYLERGFNPYKKVTKPKAKIKEPKPPRVYRTRKQVSLSKVIAASD